MLRSLTVISFAITALISACLLIWPLMKLLRQRFGQGDDPHQVSLEHDDNPATREIDQKLLRMLVPTMVFHRASWLDSTDFTPRSRR